uniref:Uncharacterized protein n=1 Tax=Oryza barthii TaxID=65489 RepID=A0A0D3FN84_9ORYZ
MGLSACNCKASLLLAVLLAATLLRRGLGAAPPLHPAGGGGDHARRLIGDGAAARPLLHAAAGGASAPGNAGAGSVSVSRQSREQGGSARRRPVARRVLLRGVNGEASKSKPSCGSNYEPPCRPA